MTGLAAANDGKFPMLEVIHMIDGRQSRRGHGSPMPVWGDWFTKTLPDAGPYGKEALVRARILSIAYYLEEMQEK